MSKRYKVEPCKLSSDNAEKISPVHKTGCDTFDFICKGRLPDNPPSSSKDWATIVEEEHMNQLNEQKNFSKYQRVPDDTLSSSKDRATIAEEERTDQQDKPKNLCENPRSNPSRLKRQMQSNDNFRVKKVSAKSKKVEYECNPDILERRQKQIDYGKNTVCYQRYIGTVDKNSRTGNLPQTPNKYVKYSRRSWDAQIKMWRRQLHIWDPPVGGNNDASNISMPFDYSDLDMSFISDTSTDVSSVKQVSCKDSNGDDSIDSNRDPCNKRMRTSSTKSSVIDTIGRRKCDDDSLLCDDTGLDYTYDDLDEPF